MEFTQAFRDQLAELFAWRCDLRLIAYLFLGWPEEEHSDDELERASWEDRLDIDNRVLTR